MNAKQRTIAILLLVAGLIVSACRLGGLLGPVPTSIPPLPPTSATIAGIETPITVGGAELLIAMATNDTSLYDSGPFAIQHPPEETILHIEAQVVSGNIDLNTLANSISLTDENGKQYLPVSYGNEKPFWEFMVPIASKSFMLHFPDCQTVKLDSILKMVP